MQLEASTAGSSNNVLVSSFVASAIAYIIFLSLRGFGWDGDSVVSAMQFIKLLNPDIFGLVDDGTFPKLLCIVLFGFPNR